MDIVKYNKTFTTKFILPLLFKQDTNYPDLFNNSFINAYVGDIRNKEYDDKILVVFSDYPSLLITQQMPSSIAEYKEEDKYVLVFDLPEQCIDDYYLFLTGKYNQFTEHSKDRIMQFWQCDKDSLLYNVLTDNKEAIKNYLKTKDFKRNLSVEVPWFPPIIRNEILGVS